MSRFVGFLTCRFRSRNKRPQPTTGDPVHRVGAPVVRFSSGLIERLQERIAAFEPERGGALLSSEGVVQEFIEDHAGRYSSASWDISSELTEQVGDAEEAGLGILVGTVHSHPDGIPDPSSTDVRTTTHALEQNPHLDALLICVVTRGEPRNTDLPIGQQHKMSIHILSRGASGTPVLERGHGEVVTSGTVDDIEQEAKPWQEGDDDGFLPPEGNDRLSRVRGLIGSLQGKSVVVAGCGSVGSRIAEDLVRSGVGHVILIDPDEVSEANIARSVYTYADIGLPKVWALARRLRDINPQMTLVSLAGSLYAHAEGALDIGPDLIILATDDMVEQGDFAVRAYERGIPQVSCSLYRKAAAGEISVIMPVLRTPCWGCLVGANQLSSSERPSTNYGVDTRLVSESGLGSSINLVASVASQAALAVLAGPTSVHGSGLVRLLAQGRTFGIVTTVPNWPVMDQVLPAAPHQSHPRSLWPVVRRSELCPVCGPRSNRLLSLEAGGEGALDAAQHSGRRGQSPAVNCDTMKSGAANCGCPVPESTASEGMSSGEAVPGTALKKLEQEFLEVADHPDTSWRTDPNWTLGTGSEEQNNELLC